MENQRKPHFNDQLRERTMSMAAGVFKLFNTKEIGTIIRPSVNQVIRSSSSVAANFRAATRARSDAEFYAKICIVAEECDETQFWMDYLIRIRFLTTTDCVDLQKEIEEEVRIFTTIKQKMKEKISKRD